MLTGVSPATSAKLLKKLSMETGTVTCFVRQSLEMLHIICFFTAINRDSWGIQKLQAIIRGTVILLCLGNEFAHYLHWLNPHPRKFRSQTSNNMDR